jgi:CheY-like chemotaxis protein
MAKILLIDDEDNIRMMVRLALQQKHTVEQARDGNEGLELFGAGVGWDLVLLDYRMPGMNGMDVLDAMRAKRPRVNVIIISAFGTPDLFRDAMQHGATDFLRKPFTIDMLRGSVQAALAHQSDALWAEPEPTLVGGSLTFESSTLNGYRIKFRTGSCVKAQGETLYTFAVQTPEGQSQACTVLLPGYIPELVRAQTNRDTLPAGDRFWEGMCEEALSNYLWQNGGVPQDGVLRITELTPDLQGWISAVIQHT